MLVNKKVTAFQLQSLVQCEIKNNKGLFNLVFVHLFFKDGCHNLAELFSFFFRKVPLTFSHGIEFRGLLGYTLNCLGRRMPSDKERNAFDPFLRYKSKQLLTRFLIRNLSCTQTLVDLFLFFFCKVLKVKNVFIDKFVCNGRIFR